MDAATHPMHLKLSHVHSRRASEWQFPGGPKTHHGGRGAGVVFFGKIIPRTFRIRPGSIAAHAYEHPNDTFRGPERHITGVRGRGSCYSERSSLELSESVLDRLLRAHMNVCLAECPGTHKNGRGQFFSERSSLDQPDPVLDRLLYAQMSVCSAECTHMRRHIYVHIFQKYIYTYCQIHIYI